MTTKTIEKNLLLPNSTKKLTYAKGDADDKSIVIQSALSCSNFHEKQGRDDEYPQQPYKCFDKGFFSKFDEDSHKYDIAKGLSEPIKDNGILDKREGLYFFVKYDDGITTSVYEPIFTKEESGNDSALWLKGNVYLFLSWVIVFIPGFEPICFVVGVALQ